MKLKINIHARLKRHARNSPSLNRKRIFSFLKKFKFFSLFIVIILPVYPSFGAFGLNEETAVGNYDETTIITSYEGDNEDASLFSKESGFIKSNTALDDTRDLTGANKLLIYSVQEGDSLSTIAQKFDISVNSIIWANNFTKEIIIHPKDVIKIPPITGLIYVVAAGDTIESVAQKYKIPLSKIVEQNRLTSKQELLIGQELIMPGAIKIISPKPVSTAIAKKDDPKKKLFVKTSIKKNEYKPYATSYTGKGNRFVWGNCTYFVANHKNVTWHGNANAWLRNAAAAGVPTGNNAIPGAIISFKGGGYNPYYGHVGLVVDVQGNDVVVKDMNYRRLNEVTIRKISKTDPSIRGYIYTD